jgi:septal ring factor EnvC (AmiA/AmiB activator)
MNARLFLFFYGIFVCCFSFNACRTFESGRNWDDATLVAELKAELESARRIVDEQRQLIESMDDTINNLQSGLAGAREAINASTVGLANSLKQTSDLRSLWSDIEKFVEQLIAEEQKLTDLLRERQYTGGSSGGEASGS